MRSDAEYDTLRAALLPGQQPPRRRSDGRMTLMVFCVVFFLGAVAMAVVAATEHRQAERERERQAVEKVASELAQRLWTYDFHRIDELNEGVLPLATGRFEREWRESFPALKQLVLRAEGTSTVELNDVFSTDVNGDQASAVVVYNHSVAGKAGQRSNSNIYVRMALLKVGGSWKVNDVFDLDRDSLIPPPTTPVDPAK